MTNFKSAKEMAQALFFDMKKIMCDDWSEHEYVYWSDRDLKLVDENERDVSIDLSEFDIYGIYEEPKQPEYFYQIVGKVAGSWVMQAYLEKESNIPIGFNKTGRKFIENDKGELVEVKDV